MRRKNQKNFCVAARLLAAFALWTAAVCLVDVRSIGPLGSSVGLGAVNQFVHRLTGVHMALYEITDWLSLVPLGIVLAFGLLGLVQWVRRKQLRRVDGSILILGGFYITVLAAFAFFEKAVVNYRPILIEGILESSYPSSTTMLVMCVMPTAVMELRGRIQNGILRKCTASVMTVFTVLMVIGRLVSGVHWVTDIVGGALLSGGLVMLYRSVMEIKENQ